MLFKYMSSPWDLFVDGYIRATQPSALNDPFEAIYSNNGLNELSKHFPDGYEGHDFQPDENPYISYVRENFNSIGVISLSESKDNLLMWSHYANSHKGFVVGLMALDYLGFSIFDSLFQPSCIQTGILGNGYSLYDGQPMHVQYRKSVKYNNDKFDHDYSNVAGEGFDRILRDIFLQKSEEWVYEKEQRIVLRLEQADVVKTKDYDQLHQNAKKLIIDNNALTKKDGYDVIDLTKIHDEGFRCAIAATLARQSVNPDNIYLFKLSQNTITSCFKGLSCRLDDSVLTPNNSLKYRYFDILQVVKDRELYMLDFVSKQ